MSADFEHTVLLKGISGSRNHNLHTKDSDYDYRGVYGVPARSVLSLEREYEYSITTTGHNNPGVADASYFELSRSLGLALKANPQALEAYGCQVYVYFDPEWGPRLLEQVPTFLGGEPIFGSFLIQARAHLRKLKHQAGENANDLVVGLDKKTYREARNILRLAETGYNILRTGKLDFYIEDREFYMEELPNFSLGAVEHHLDIFTSLADTFIDHNFPPHSDYDKANDLVLAYRKANW